MHNIEIIKWPTNARIGSGHDGNLSTEVATFKNFIRVSAAIESLSYISGNIIFLEVKGES